MSTMYPRKGRKCSFACACPARWSAAETSWWRRDICALPSSTSRIARAQRWPIASLSRSPSSGASSCSAMCAWCTWHSSSNPPIACSGTSLSNSSRSSSVAMSTGRICKLAASAQAMLARSIALNSALRNTMAGASESSRRAASLPEKANAHRRLAWFCGLKSDGGQHSTAAQMAANAAGAGVRERARDQATLASVCGSK
mmetsp:Transcript_25322/g.64374  ORF Transcript_25322/g.64374 Transcript_25322/m.64374 type:complete len:200 (-) Transcript_25322:848-1447(-)